MPTDTITDLEYYQKKDQSIAPWLSKRLDFIQEVSEYLVPNRAVINGVDDTGKRKDENIISSVARLHVRTLIAGLMTGNVPQNFKFYNLVAKIRSLMEQTDVKEWLYNETQAQFDTMSSTNFYRTMFFHFLDAACFLCGLTLVEQDPVKAVTYTDIKPGTYRIGYNAKGDEDQVGRDVMYTLSQAAEVFGLENLSKKWQERYQNPENHGETVTVVHYLGPNRNHVPGSLVSGDKAFASVWWEKGVPTADAKVLQLDGFDEFPYLVTEWWDCPAFGAMAEILQHYQMTTDTMHGVEMEMDPPLVGPAALQGIKNTAGAYFPTTQESGREEKVEPVFQHKLNLEAMILERDHIEDIISRWFYSKTLLMLSSLKDRQRTATEVIEMKNELMMQFGPVTDSFNRMLDHNADLLYAHRLKLGLVEPVPQMMDGVEFKPDYCSAMSQAQKMSGFANEKMLMQTAVELSGVIGEVVWDKVNWMEFFNMQGEKLNVYPKLMRPDEEAESRIRARTESAERKAAAESARQEAGTLKDLSETQAGGASLLEQMAQTGT